MIPAARSSNVDVLGPDTLQLTEREVLDLISGGAALTTVLKRIALAMEGALPEARAAVSLADDDGSHLRHGIAPNIPDYGTLIDNDAFQRETGARRTVLLARDRIISTDIEADPLWHNLLAFARAQQLRSCWSTPALDTDGRVLGMLAAYYDHPRTPTGAELSCLDRGARMVGLAIKVARGFDSLRESEATFREAFLDAAAGIAVVAPSGLIQEVNDAFARSLGYEPEELRGVDLRTLTPAEDLTGADEVRDDLLSGRRQSYVREKRYRTKQGGIVWVRNSVSMRRTSEGRAISAIIVSEDITPQKNAERALRHREALLEVASRVGHLGGWEVRLPSHTMTWSEQVGAIYGLPSDMTLSVDEAIAYFAPEHRDTMNAAFQDCIRSATPWDLEAKLVNAEGTTTWVRSIGQAVRDEAGHLVAIQGALQDISDRKQAEARLRESETRFHAVASATADVIWDWDLKSGVVWWSDDFEASFGYPVHALEPDVTSWTSRIHPADRERVIGGLRKAVEAREPLWADEYRFLHRDGSILEIEDHGRLIMAADGTPVRFVSGMSDITARRRFERELRERMRELRCLYRVLELATSDTRSIAEICTDIASLLPTSVVHEQLAVGRIDAEGAEYRSSDWQTPQQALRSPIRIGNVEIGYVEVGYAIVMPHVDGQSDPFLPEERTLIEAIATHIGRMINDRRMAETLNQAQRLRAVGELTGGIVHDFNNLLTVILGSIELLTLRLESDSSAQALALTAQSAAENAAELTSSLLAFARRQALSPTVTNVSRLIAGMSTMLRRTLGEHIEIKPVLEARVWETLIDRPRLESAILNLCINSRDAMPQGGRLTIKTANLRIDRSCVECIDGVEPGDYVLLSVRDTGTGMPPEVLARVFDPFFTTKEIGKGSGLGLSMVYGFVKQSHGHVQILSKVRRGTTVRILLPRVASVPQQRELDLDTSSVLGGAGRVLLVEDDDVVRGYVSGQLAEFGYDVVSARNGLEALRTLERDDRFDLLFTDIVMPGGMNGWQLAEQARHRRPDLPILFTTGHADKVVDAYEPLGPGTRLITKPFRRQELAKQVRTALGLGLAGAS